MGSFDMKTAGMIGGLGPESTVDYYRSIIARYRARNPDRSYPSLIINSLDLSKGLQLVDTGRLSELTDYLAAGVQSLVRAGAVFGFFSANTPHIVFDEVQRQSAIPLLSIVRATCDRTKALGLKNVGLFGTRFTMQATFYPDEFQRAGIAVVRPKESEQDFIHKKYLDELLNGKFLPATRAELLSIASRMKVQEGTEAMILAGTELPLLLRDSEGADIQFLDTTEIHVEVVVDELLR
jgi:aspartate racemase